jgi:hypothetical protein
MRLSDLLAHLENVREQHGDPEVMTADWEHMRLQPVENAAIVMHHDREVLVITDIDPTEVGWG